MTPEIATVLAILAVAVLLFETERIRVDLVALLVLVSLALTGLVMGPGGYRFADYTRAGLPLTLIVLLVTLLVVPVLWSF